MQRRWTLRFVAGFVSLTLAGAACSPSQEQPAQIAMVAEAPPTSVPTVVPTTEPIPFPTATPEPTATLVPQPTATVIPSATPIPEPTAVPEPTATDIPVPTAVPEPVAEPTAVPEATSVPEPTLVPEPTDTPEPTATPEAEPTPEPEGTGGGPAGHVVTTTGYATLGLAGSAWITLPAASIELIGFHEASHPGAQAINAAGSGVPMMVLDSRGRGTPARSAADIVVPPGEPLRAPVTGTVVAAKTYVLYCEHTDSLVYIEPDGLPGWQVRLFHVQGNLPEVGARVIAGETIVADGANMLPFESQIDTFTSEPSWPHTHLEVVDTTVPDTRPPGGGC